MHSHTNNQLRYLIFYIHHMITTAVNEYFCKIISLFIHNHTPMVKFVDLNVNKLLDRIADIFQGTTLDVFSWHCLLWIKFLSRIQLKMCHNGSEWLGTNRRNVISGTNDETVPDDVIKWKHFPRYRPFVRGIHRSRWIPRTKASYAELWCFFFDLSLNKRLSKQSRGWWFETQSHP